MVAQHRTRCMSSEVVFSRSSSAIVLAGARVQRQSEYRLGLMSSSLAAFQATDHWGNAPGRPVHR